MDENHDDPDAMRSWLKDNGWQGLSRSVRRSSRGQGAGIVRPLPTMRHNMEATVERAMRKAKQHFGSECLVTGMHGVDGCHIFPAAHTRT